MSSRGGGRGGNPNRGGGAGGGRGGGGGGSGGRDSGGAGEKKKRENILNLTQYVDKRLKVKFMGGREVTGVLKGFDQLMNLVMDEVIEEYENNTMEPRSLGLVVLRGPNVVLISPTDGSAEIENPFA